jgi:hypothetical protein
MSESDDYVRRQAFAEERARAEASVDRNAYEVPRPEQWIDEENDPYLKWKRGMPKQQAQAPAPEPKPDVDLLAAHKQEVNARLEAAETRIAAVENKVEELRARLEDFSLDLWREAIGGSLAEYADRITDELSAKIAAEVGELRADVTMMRAVDCGAVDGPLDVPSFLTTKSNGHTQQ